ncbi:hypothetical protein IFM89_019581 [Coptis chinensis]|uniref:Nas2 N-terminal domain-containing protein n=1 Tax=Coptis chinensis TaxID=261450 RepID=A0A835M5H3_9MAGN|nr:hypothetical protein IFM89_019581 [Coptis chinensis]
MVAPNLKAETMCLIEKREAIETEMNAIISTLTQAGGPGLTGNLLDFEGFPRSDIDVHAVRAQRHHLAELRNDHKDITNKIEESLQVLHSARLARNISAPAKSPGKLLLLFSRMLHLCRGIRSTFIPSGLHFLRHLTIRSGCQELQQRLFQLTPECLQEEPYIVSCSFFVYLFCCTAPFPTQPQKLFYIFLDEKIFNLTNKKIAIILLRNEVHMYKNGSGFKCWISLTLVSSPLQDAQSSMDVDLAVGVPFAMVDEITDVSPSAEDGLQLGDQIMKFGNVEFGDNLLQKLASEVQSNQDRAVPLVILRHGAPINLAVTPRQWNGRGLLGYVWHLFI